MNMKGYKQNLNLIIFNYIKDGLNPASISKKLNISKTNLSYYTTKLLKEGYIKKIGYGVWEVQKEVQENKEGYSKPFIKGKVVKKKLVRGHGFMIKLRLPKISHWRSREDYFNKNKISYKRVNGGQRILVRNHKVHVYNNSILIYLNKDFMGRDANESKDELLYYIRNFFLCLESLFKVSFKINKEHRFEIPKKHYGLLNNILAKQYNKEKKKLYIKNEFGYWAICDNSLNLHEFETHKNSDPSPDQAERSNIAVQTLFNDIEKYARETNEFIKLSDIVKLHAIFASNIETHIKAIKDLGDGVTELRKIFKHEKSKIKFNTSHEKTQKNLLDF